ncbi:hypothetical protein BJV78DRAFT_888787 [Lactifluus subvellereus]|nr:hypothetical protein BJV78DRAFT_888787 [Lactifluus subvellereus]
MGLRNLTTQLLILVSLLAWDMVFEKGWARQAKACVAESGAMGPPSDGVGLDTVRCTSTQSARRADEVGPELLEFNSQ